MIVQPNVNDGSMKRKIKRYDRCGWFPISVVEQLKRFCTRLRNSRLQNVKKNRIVLPFNSQSPDHFMVCSWDFSNRSSINISRQKIRVAHNILQDNLSDNISVLVFSAWHCAWTFPIGMIPRQWSSLFACSSFQGCLHIELCFVCQEIACNSQKNNRYSKLTSQQPKA